jgi:uncharacterized protein (DUF1800 family)
MLDDATALHLANRLGLGPASGDLAHIKQLGFEGFLGEQLNPNLASLPPALAAQLKAIPSFGKSTFELSREFWWRLLPGAVTGKGAPGKKEQNKLLKMVSRGVTDQARVARLARAVGSPHQLHEALVEFWFNHFNIYHKRGENRVWIGAYEDEAIRPHTLGKFGDLLLATAKHPAMLTYLNNDENVAPGSVPTDRGRKNKAAGINENYAREVMELHTLGVDGGYRQADVVALAHILTGWRIGVLREAGAGGSGIEREKGGFRFDARHHDPTAQTLLGRRFSGNSMEEGESALLMLARHPSTARHVSFKLAQFFVADEPTPALIADMARTFSQTDGDIKAVLRVMFESGVFRDPENFGRKFKTPYRYVVSTARVTGIRHSDVEPLAAALIRLGQPLYACGTPDGYACTEAAWLDSDAMLRRISFAVAVANGEFGAAHPATSTGSPVDPDRLMAILGAGFSAKTRAALAQTSREKRAAAILGSPEFMRC